MHVKVLGTKQRERNARFQQVFENITAYVSRDHIEAMLDKTTHDIQRRIRDKRVGYGWSAGKDSMVLKFLMERVGVERCVMGMTYDLEYPAVLRWVTDNMPDGLVIYNSGHTLEWLANHQRYLFPANKDDAKYWFKNVQHKAQAHLVKHQELDMIILGRRVADRNHIGIGANIYVDGKGIKRYSPLAYWSHEEVLGVIHYFNLPLSPFYSWVNGWVVGTGCWPARQWTGSVANGWREVYSIDPDIVKRASAYIDSAYRFLKFN